jgi:oligopeptide transport system substrate-binding protein
MFLQSMTFKKITQGFCSLFIALGLLWPTGCTKKVDQNDSDLYLYVRSNIKGLDPAGLNGVYANRIASVLFEPLFSYHYLKRPLVLQPEAAEAMPEVSKNGLVHTIKLKKGLRFHDDPAFPNGKGREVVADDYIYQWKRLADASNKSENFWIFDGKIKGINEWRQKLADGKIKFSDPIPGFKALDSHTIQIELSRPFFQLHYVLAMTPSAAVPHEAIEKYGKEFLNHPVGSGPYVFKEWIRNSRVILEKNPNWRDMRYPSEGEKGDKERGLLADAGEKLPFANKITVNIIVEDQPRWLKFMNGDLDAAEIPKDNFDSSVMGSELTPDLKNKEVQLDIFEEPDVTYMAFNMEDPFLGKHKKVRQAMTLAYDSETAREKFYNNRALVAQSPIPPTVDGFERSFKNPLKDFNVERAKKMLAEAGFKNGVGIPVIEYSATNSSTARQMAEYFAQQMKQIGIQVKISSNSWPQFNKKIKERRAMMWGIAWLGDYPDAENFLQLLYGKNAAPGPNGSNFNNSEYNKLYEKAALMPPGPQRTNMYKKMRDIVVDENPWIPGVHRLGYIVYHKWVNNFKRHRIITDYYKYMRVDPKVRAQLKKEKF